VSLESGHLGLTQQAVNGLSQLRLELGALHSVMGFTLHQFTCL
jgi:hypothetical protein